MGRRQSFRAWEIHLEEVIGVGEAQAVVEDLEGRVTRADLDDVAAQLTERLSALWRRDLLLVITGQFVALAGVITAVA